ncbi:MAG TPA: type II secretion system protein [Verrucomicrobiae bacterium]|nr:type II secretion system protein [Verrucomicrobiae bacterium]
MKPRVSGRKTAALTLVEVLVVIAMLFVLAVLLLPSLAHSGPSKASLCLSNLKQIGLAYSIWAGDHNGKFPMQVSAARGGTKELTADGRNPWLNFLVMSNVLVTPKLLICPADRGRVTASGWTNGFNATNISYFVGLDATSNQPQTFLSGDDNFVINRIAIRPDC